MKIVVIDGEPKAKKRARFTRKGSAYQPSEDLAAEQRTGWFVRRVFDKPWSGNVALGCVFFRPNRQRIDVDNMLKHVCDASNGIAWFDDSQVTALIGFAELDAIRPRTIVMFARHESSLIRDRDITRTCEHCGKEFVASSSKPQRICSRECRNDWQRGRNRERGKPHTPCIVCGGGTSKPGVKRCRSCWAKRSQEKQ